MEDEKGQFSQINDCKEATKVPRSYFEIVKVMEDIIDEEN